MAQVYEAVFELFRAHGVPSALQDEWITFPGSGLRASASIVSEVPQQIGLTVQLDVRFELPSGRTIVESFAGMGATREMAAADAIHCFTVNSFHVLVAAFLSAEEKPQDEWELSGKMRPVVVGDLGVRGKPPVPGTELAARFEQFERKLKQHRFGPETHWVRLYYGQARGKALACEVLLDNEAWAEMQSEAAALDWPIGEDFYSVRVFLVIPGEDAQKAALKPGGPRKKALTSPWQFWKR